MKRHLRTTCHLLAVSLTALVASAGAADLNSPVAAWRTIDDKTWERAQ
jgi:hypothetical protein